MNSRDWTCPKCWNNCFGSKPTCKKCGTANPARQQAASAPAPQQARAGDWQCKACGDVQFASRTACRKCNASKPAVESADAASDNSCLVCFTNVRNAGLVHGDAMHMGVCFECANKIMTSNGACPMCRERVEKVVKVY